MAPSTAASADGEETASFGHTRTVFSVISPDLLRALSERADNAVEALIGSKMSPRLSVVFVLNSLTGLSLLTLPYGFSKAGLVLGASILLVCLLMAFVTATFMCEALAIANALAYEEASASYLAEERDVRERLGGKRRRSEVRVAGGDASEFGVADGGSSSDDSDSSEEGDSSPQLCLAAQCRRCFGALGLVSEDESSGSDGCSEVEARVPARRRADTIDVFMYDNRRKNAEPVFKIRERVELGAMGELTFKGRKWGTKISSVLYVTVLAFTYGTAAALVVTINTTLKSTVCSTKFLVGYGDCTAELESIIYRTCVVATFFVSLPFCFANLQKTKKLTLSIMILRSFAIVSVFAVSAWFAAQRLRREGVAAVLKQTPLWNPSQFTAVFGNAVFLFGIHMYLPSMISPLEPQLRAPCVILSAFFIAFVIIVSICATAMVAWGGEAAGECSPHPSGQFCTVQSIYNLNFAPLKFGGGALGLFILFYPAMTLANVPIAAITTRNTMCRWLKVKPADPDQPYTTSNVIMTLAVLVPPFLVGFVTTNVQAVIRFVGSYAGLTVAMLWPVVLVRRLRSELLKSHEARLETSIRVRQHIQRYFNDQHESPEDGAAANPLRSRCAGPLGYGVVLAFYVASLVMVTRTLFVGA